jgi:hypothetical protein
MRHHSSTTTTTNNNNNKTETIRIVPVERQHIHDYPMIRTRWIRHFKADMSWRQAITLLALLIAQSDCFLSIRRLPRCSLFAIQHSDTTNDIQSPRASLENTTTTALYDLELRPGQKRRHSTNRRPRRYWQNFSNFELEIRQFWKDHKVPTSDNVLLIPNESLLYYYNRHDIRGCISAQGGREVLALREGILILPGRWEDAVKEYPEILADPSLSKDRPPSTYYSSNGKLHSNASSIHSARWMHSPTRKEKGYWSSVMVFKELYVSTL